MNDTYYFSHDYNSRSDTKIKKLICKHGMLGYGLFWAIIEDLYNNSNELQSDYDSIAYDLHTESNIVKSIINDFDLFVLSDNTFMSLSINKRLGKREDKSKQASNAANVRWEKYKEEKEKIYADALRTNSGSNAIKGKEIKENNNIPKIKEITIPSHSDVNNKYSISVKELLNKQEDEIDLS